MSRIHPSSPMNTSRCAITAPQTAPDSDTVRAANRLRPPRRSAQGHPYHTHADAQRRARSSLPVRAPHHTAAVAGTDTLSRVAWVASLPRRSHGSD